MADSLEEKPVSKVSRLDSGAEDRTLIEAVQNGDRQKYGVLVRRHQKRLFRFIYGMTGSFDKAEDIVQEAFIKAYGAIDTFRLDMPFYPWLSRIARNLALNMIYRDEKSDSLDRMTEAGFDPQSQELGPMESLLEGENKKRFFKALKAMPSKYRAVFVLRSFEGMDYSEIASYLKIPPGTVDSRLYRARQFLMEHLSDLLG